jgi:hypothetical protein
MHTRTKIILAAALVFTGAGTALANDLENNASPSQIEREWAESHGRGYVGNSGTAYGFYGSQNQADTEKQRMKAHDR